MMQRVAIVILLSMLGAGIAHAAETTATLNVHNAYCELCPSIVTKALQHVSGVKAVEVTKPDTDGNMMATVTFDNAIATVPQFVAATANAGYPSEVAN